MDIYSRKRLIVLSTVVVTIWIIYKIFNNFRPDLTSLSNIGIEILRQNPLAAIYSILYLAWWITFIVSEFLTVVNLLMMLNNLINQNELESIITLNKCRNLIKQDIMQLEIIINLCYLLLFPVIMRN